MTGSAGEKVKVLKIPNARQPLELELPRQLDGRMCVLVRELHLLFILHSGSRGELEQTEKTASWCQIGIIALTCVCVCVCVFERERVCRCVFTETVFLSRRPKPQIFKVLARHGSNIC